MSTIKDIPANRVVAVLTPLVFAPLAGAISVAAADLAPGVNVDPSSLTAIFIAGATIAFGKAAQWTKGWQAWEQQSAAGTAAAGFDDAGDSLVANATGDEDIEDIEDVEDIEGEPEAGVDEEHEPDEEPEFPFESDEDVEEELMALAAGHEE
jgi:hypothetical protein